MIRQSRKTKKTTMAILADRFVTDSVTFDNVYPADKVGVMVPKPDDASTVVLQVAPREHRFNYPCLDGKTKPWGPHGYADNGIIFEFDMDDADGTTLKDRVNGLVLTEAGNPTYRSSAATSGLGHGVVFDGTGDEHVGTFANAAAAAPYPLVETGDFSVECVFNASNANTGANDTLVCCRDGAAGIGWSMLFDANQYVDFHVDDTTEAALTGATDAATDSIVHALVSLDRDGNGVIYINGVVDDTTDISGSPGTLLNVSADTSMVIGCDAASTATSNLYGTVYFVRVYNFALTAAQALENYRIIMNQGYPGWTNFADPAWQDGGDLCAAGEQPVYTDLSRVKTLNNMAFRARHLTEQTTTPAALDFLWIFE